MDEKSSPGHGGKRPGAGRPHGSVAERTYDAQLGVVCFADQLAAWRERARTSGVGFSEWVRRTLDAAT